MTTKDIYDYQHHEINMIRIKEHYYTLHHQELPKEKPLEHTGLIDIYKISLQSLARDIRCHSSFHHVRTNDKSAPCIPYLHKKIQSFDHQKLMDDIKKRKRIE